jgi:hypothetical protein
MMHLDSKTLEQFKAIGPQKENDNPLVVVTFAINREGAYYYATEYDPRSQTFFGYIRGSACDGYQNFGFSKLKIEELREISTYVHRKPRPIQTLIPELECTNRAKKLQSIRGISFSRNLKDRTV